MKNKLELNGIYVPLITPFDSNNIEKIDEKLLRELVNFSIDEQKTAGLVPCGTTGECPTTDFEEHLEIIKIVMDESNGRVPVIAGTGANSTKEAIFLTKRAEDIGVDGSLQVVPYYNKPTQAGLIKHFETIAKNTDLPLILYDIPGRSGISISLDTYKELIQIDNIIGVKHAPRNITDTMELLNYLQTENIKGFDVVSGEDALTFSMTCLGGKGGITAASHIIGKEYSEMVKHIQNNNMPKALELHNQTLKIVNLMFCESNPGPVKYALSKMGFHTNSLRLPLVPITEANQKKIDEELKKLGKFKN